MPRYKVVRPYPSPKAVKKGQILTDPTMRNLSLLVRQGYLKKLHSDDEVPEIVGKRSVPEVTERDTVEEVLSETVETSNAVFEVVEEVVSPEIAEIYAAAESSQMVPQESETEPATPEATDTEPVAPVVDEVQKPAAAKKAPAKTARKTKPKGSKK